MRRSSAIGRIAGIAAVLLAAVGVGVVLLGNDDEYIAKAHFENASQLVKGNLVQVSGKPVGKISEIDLTPQGQAEVTMTIDPDYAPLREGTLATVRQSSLSGIANRYIDLRLAPDRARDIPDGGVIASDKTSAAVDLDQLFNVFEPKTRKALSKVFRGSATQYGGRGDMANEGWRFLNPSLATSSRLFDELNRDTPLLERFIVSSSELVTDVADRRDDLAGLIDSLATTTSAIGRQRAALADAIGQLPDFMRRSNTTFVNLRSTLDDLEPLIDASKPVARQLRPFVRELRPLALDARPTVRDLSRLIRRSGADNDLIELTRGTVPLRDIAIGPVQANGKEREGSFPASTKALNEGTPELAFARPYVVDLTGWFDDFGHSGTYDALGGMCRCAPQVNAFTAANGLLQPIPPQLRDEVFQNVASTKQNSRCPGSSEHRADDGSNPFKPTPDFNCNPAHTLPGE